AGSHTVRFAYVDREFWFGLVLAGLTTLGLLGGTVLTAVLRRRFRRRALTPAGAPADPAPGAGPPGSPAPATPAASASPASARPRPARPRPGRPRLGQSRLGQSRVRQSCPGRRPGRGTVTDAAEAIARARNQTTVRAELLRNLIRKDLKIKYQGSVLGFLWS